VIICGYAIRAGDCSVLLLLRSASAYANAACLDAGHIFNPQVVVLFLFAVGSIVLYQRYLKKRLTAGALET